MFDDIFRTRDHPAANHTCLSGGITIQRLECVFVKRTETIDRTTEQFVSVFLDSIFYIKTKNSLCGK